MRNILLTLFLTIVISNLSAQGKVLQSQKMTSKILNKEVLYSVYLPPNFDQSKDYPVIYLLHGYGNNETTWITDGHIEIKMNKAITDSIIPPTVIIMPNGENRWYVNATDTIFNWEDMFMLELMPHAENQYKINSQKENRTIWGASMGGFAALKYAMTYPDKFATCIAFSPAIYQDMTIGKRYQISESPLNIIQKTSKETLNQVRYLIDCGDKDFLYWGNANLHILMRSRQINHEFRMRAGKHGWIYWRDGVEFALQFIAEATKNEGAKN